MVGEPGPGKYPIRIFNPPDMVLATLGAEEWERFAIRRIILVCLLAVCIILWGTGCEKEEETPVVTMTIQGMGDIVLELYSDKAPNTVRNFVHLAKQGFYDGLTFHRVIDGFMIQGGDPLGNGTGGPGYSIKGEFPNNGFTQNDLSHLRGAISMARQSIDTDSAGSQFFIVQEDQVRLDGDYAVFGKVIDGMDIVDVIAQVDTDRNDKPITPVVIEKVTVEGADDMEPPDIIQ